MVGRANGQGGGQGQQQWMRFNTDGLWGRESMGKGNTRKCLKHFARITISLNMGMRMLQMATLEAKAVQKRLIRMQTPIVAKVGSDLMNDILSPSILAMPLRLLPSARAKPPPILGSTVVISYVRQSSTLAYRAKSTGPTVCAFVCTPRRGMRPWCGQWRVLLGVDILDETLTTKIRQHTFTAAVLKERILCGQGKQ